MLECDGITVCIVNLLNQLVHGVSVRLNKTRYCEEALCSSCTISKSSRATNRAFSGTLSSRATANASCVAITSIITYVQALMAYFHLYWIRSAQYHVDNPRIELRDISRWGLWSSRPISIGRIFNAPPQKWLHAKRWASLESKEIWVGVKFYYVDFQSKVLKIMFQSTECVKKSELALSP